MLDIQSDQSQSAPTAEDKLSNVFYREANGAVPAGWWWHKLPASDERARALSGCEGVDFDGPWSTSAGAYDDFVLNMKLQRKVQGTAA